MISGITKRVVTAENQDEQYKIEKYLEAPCTVSNTRPQEKVMVVTPPPLHYLAPGTKRFSHVGKQVTRK